MQHLPSEAAATVHNTAVLRLVVRNHPGVMSHVCGLFARRAFNVEGILCVPVGDGTRSAVLLLVNEDGRLEQLVRQLGKLEDVIEIDRDPSGHAAFAAVARRLGPAAGVGSAGPLPVGSLRTAKSDRP